LTFFIFVVAGVGHFAYGHHIIRSQCTILATCQFITTSSQDQTEQCYVKRV